jgi:hypothetical protein
MNSPDSYISAHLIDRFSISLSLHAHILIYSGVWHFRATRQLKRQFLSENVIDRRNGKWGCWQNANVIAERGFDARLVSLKSNIVHPFTATIQWKHARLPPKQRADYGNWKSVRFGLTPCSCVPNANSKLKGVCVLGWWNCRLLRQAPAKIFTQPRWGNKLSERSPCDLKSLLLVLHSTQSDRDEIKSNHFRPWFAWISMFY